MVLTACRSGEVRLASWDDINLETAEWTIPGERMKAQRPHRVPLSGRAMEILQEARTLGGGGGLVFPSPEGPRVFRHQPPQAASRTGHRGRAARLPVELQGLGGRMHGHPPCGHGGGLGARGPQQGGGRIRSFRPVRAQACPDGRLGELSGWRKSITRDDAGRRCGRSRPRPPAGSSGPPGAAQESAGGAWPGSDTSLDLLGHFPALHGLTGQKAASSM